MELQPDWQLISTTFTTIFTAIAALAAFLSARATRHTVQEMERARIAQTRPLVLVTSRVQDKEILIAIKNFGGPASEVRINSLQSSTPWADGDYLNQAPLFSQPIPVLAPGEEITIHIGLFSDYWFSHSRDVGGARIKTGWSGNPVVFVFDLSYEDPFTGQQYTETSRQVSIRHFAPPGYQTRVPALGDS